MTSDASAPLAGDGIAVRYPDRCRICSLPLPRSGADDGICSRRCAARRKESARVAADAVVLKEQILTEISTLRKGTTICPGELSQRILTGTDQPLSLLRPLLFELAEARKIRLSQKGSIVLWPQIRGPFRVGQK